jgi:isopenicillin N synthase-like dioxygenase
VHRVARPTGSAAARPRLSLVFFTGPPGDTLVEALPGTWGPDKPKRYPPVSARAHLLQKLRVTNI